MMTVEGIRLHLIINTGEKYAPYRYHRVPWCRDARFYNLQAYFFIADFYGFGMHKKQW
jgi:hypothetical protein